MMRQVYHLTPSLSIKRGFLLTYDPLANLYYLDVAVVWLDKSDIDRVDVGLLPSTMATPRFPKRLAGAGCILSEKSGRVATDKPLTTAANGQVIA